ncbi:N-acetylmuramoyl-L-alanine amidase [Gloeothece citriformis PCC 7424]|uniref:N-acetylmuramoyl-L-alanine amidase n=1 Tax=Gloeothece citriformis (strain PCC 7424) TaxID=65393 RepID=B7KBG9_GLOC7|nr:N-acetylmuramoyl-L-alanine amidase [Gloeothece citriformis]ACK71525.1 N-acetylmuramoyl-L-alanine amidase [Gloeothece citriformis PCC 7424]
MKLQSIIMTALMFQGLCASTLAGSLEYWKFDLQQNRLEIITDDDVRPQAKMLDNPTRLVIDLPGTTLGGATERQEVSDYVKEVRVGQLNAKTTRIVVELASDYSMRPWEVKVRSLAPNRWYIQLPKFQPPDVYSLPPQEVPVAIIVPAPKPSYSTSDVVIVIDPGHGGQDPGAIGIGGLQEKGVVLSISQEVAKILSQRGVRVIMTRTSDRYISLKARVDLAQRTGANGFISIHANAIGGNQSQVNGVETYYYSTGYNLARAIHRNILRRLNVRDRGVKQARFYVLRKTSMPAVLVETGFVTGTIDNRNLSDSTYRRRMAEAIAEGIIENFR